MGTLLIYWSYKEKDKPGLKNMSLCVFTLYISYSCRSLGNYRGSYDAENFSVPNDCCFWIQIFY